MSAHQDDLDLLLSLQDRVLETPPASPSTTLPQYQIPGFLSDDGSPTKMVGKADMSVFRDAVQDYLEGEPETIEKVPQLNRVKKSKDGEIEKFSGLRIRNPSVSAAELSNHFSEIRFVRLPTIRNLLMGDTLSGCWATVGVLTEKGNPKTSSNGKNFCIWRISCLDELSIPVFLFGDAYQKNWKEQAGSVFALFNCGVRKDALGKDFSLSVYSAGQVLKMGISIDYGVCKGKRKDGMPCTMVINKRRGIYCRYHTSKASQKYSVTRTGLHGGNLRTAFRDPLKSEGIYLVDPLTDRTNISKPMQPMKVLSVDGLKKALSKAGKVTSNTHSQGIRFLTEVTEKVRPKMLNKGCERPNQQMGSSEKRFSTTKLGPTKVVTKKLEAKRKTIDQTQEEKSKQSLAKKTKQASEKMIELDLFSSEEESD